jgi:2-polyprenyl-6-methoxyphenol hydroxylase-like FAD-dependent oxidoreductase
MAATNLKGAGAGRRHAEIAGAGIAGLTTACVLAQRGWSVRVHERSPELREMGAGIYLKINSLKVLSELGVLDELKEAGMILRRGAITDRRGRPMASRVLNGTETVVTLRSQLHRTLASRAEALGVRITTSSSVLGGRPDGRISVEGIGDLSADLVIGADGLRSPVRESVGLLKALAPLPEGAIRILVPRRPGEREGTTTEQWSGDCRLGICGCSADKLYLYLIGPAAHPRASAIPVDTAFWCERFPQEADVLGRIDPHAGRHDQFSYATVSAWSAGRVAIIGDAVHAQPPNLGQGAGLAIANASALGAALDQHTDVPTALRHWESARRPVTERVQRWSYLYGVSFYAFPANRPFADAARARLTSLIHRMPLTGRRMAWANRGGHHPGELSVGADAPAP